MATRFTDENRIPTRALQIYLVLIGLAWNRQTITYGDLSKYQMNEFGTGGILDRPLDCIMRWCNANSLEPLTVLVVRSDTGVPGQGLTTVASNDWPAAQQRVFRFNWYSILPPTLKELEAIWES